MTEQKPEWIEIQEAINWMYNFLALPSEEQIKAEEDYFKATSGYSEK